MYQRPERRRNSFGIGLLHSKDPYGSNQAFDERNNPLTNRIFKQI